MAKIYTKATWVDEILAGAERFDIKTNAGAAIDSNVQINLVTSVATAGTDVNAAKMNNIENGVDALDTLLTTTLYAANNLSDVASAATARGNIGAVGLTDTQTMTNKRVTPRAGTTTSSATPTINTDNVDFYSLTALAVAITSMTTNLTGTPTEGQKLWIAITGTAARAITWGASFEAGAVALPTTTVTTTRLDVGFIWNTVTSKWRCMAAG